MNCSQLSTKKWISWSKEEMENFIWAKLRIITQQHLRKLWELFRPLEVKAQLYKFFEKEGCTLNDVLLTVYTIQICKYKVVGHHDPPRSRRNVIFFFFNFKNFWLPWVFIVAHGLSLVAASRGYSLLKCMGFSLRRLLFLRSTGFSSCGTRSLERRLSSCGTRALEQAQ